MSAPAVEDRHRPSGMPAARAVRVVHVPSGHDYVVHATVPPGAGGAVQAASTSDVGEPFVWSDGAGWLARHGGDLDVLHVHFGAEQVGVDDLAAVLDAAARAGVAVVWTVHDLTNPHLVDQRVHEAQCGLLARRAAGLVTLTAGAAAEVRRRWVREPVVVPHPHLAPLDVLARPRRPAPGGRPVVGVPLGLLRPATDPAVVRAMLGPEVGEVLDARGARLRVDLREEVLAPGFPRPDDELVGALRAAAAAGVLDLVVGPRTTEDDLWSGLGGLAALVLPYRWGTHSGWVEACHDVGTPVVAPALGHWGEQQPVHAFAGGPDGPDPAALAAALDDALGAGPRATPVLAERLAQREHSVRVHAELHALAAAGGRW